MPAFDKTGPLGTGPLGRGRGGCQQADALSSPMRGMRGGCRGQGQARGFGQGSGRGCCGGNRRGNFEVEQSPLSREEEISVLERQKAHIQSRLDALKAPQSVE